MSGDFIYWLSIVTVGVTIVWIALAVVWIIFALRDELAKGDVNE